MQRWHISATLISTLLVATLPTVSHSQTRYTDLAGTWIGEGYGCETGNFQEKVEITVNGTQLTAKKITGDNCVPAGNTTFQGRLPDSFSAGSSFPVTWTIGSPANPASSTTIQSLTVLSVNSFTSYGVKFTRETSSPQRGDIVIYRASNGDIIHSGVITATRADGAVSQIESKWQAMGRYLHDPNDSIYGKSWTVWRAKRRDGSISNLLKKGRYRLYVGFYTDKAVRDDGSVDTNDLKDRVATYSVLGGMPADSEFRKRVENYIASHSKVQPVAPPDRNYNCHGFTFTNGEESIDDKEIEKILHDNGYFRIKAQDTDGGFH